MNINKKAMLLMKILELGERQIREGKTVPVAEAMKRIKAQTKKRPSKGSRH